MEKHLFELTQIAVEAKRQDEDILPLYWKCIQSCAESTSPLSEEEERTIQQAFRYLYAAWNAQADPTRIAQLVEMACHRRFSHVSVLQEMAAREFQAQRYEHALHVYDRLLTLHALHENEYHHLKMACFKRQVFDDFSNLLLLQCLERDPDDASIQQFLLSQYVLHEKYTYSPSSMPVYKQILEREPENLNVRAILCECYYRQGKYEEAIQEGETALTAHPKLLPVLATLAKAHYAHGEYGQTVTYCQQVLEKNPARVDILLLLATVYGNNALTTNEALKLYQKALVGQPKNLTIRKALLRTYLRKLLIDEAVAESEAVLSLLNEDPDISQRDAQGVLKELIAEYERAMRREPDIRLYLVAAQLNEQIGHVNKALIYYRTMLELPLDESTLHQIVALLEKLAAFQTDNPYLYLYLGLFYHKIERYDEAKLAFRAAMYADLDEREVDEILVRYDRSIWHYPPVLVMLAHHRILTKDILYGLVNTFRESDKEDWNGVIWVLQEFYDVEDVLFALEQVFEWESFAELYPHLLPIIAGNGSHYAIQLLNSLLTHPHEPVRQEALNLLIAMQQPLTEQCLAEASQQNPYVDVRVGIASYYAQKPGEQSTYHLLNMLHDAHANIRLLVVRALQDRDVLVESLREALFREQHPAVKTEIIKLFEQLNHPQESVYLAHLLDDLLAKRYDEIGQHKMYSRIKQMLTHSEQSEDTMMFTTLIRAIGNLKLEQGIYTLMTIAVQDPSESLRLEAIEAMGNIQSSAGIAPLQELLHNSSESEEIHAAAEQAMKKITER